MFSMHFEGSAAGHLAVACLSGSYLLLCAWHNHPSSGAKAEAAAAWLSWHRAQIVTDLLWNPVIAMEQGQSDKGMALALLRCS